MESVIKRKFKTSGPGDPNSKIQLYTLWMKADQTITHAFPDVHEYPYYKKLVLHGMQRFWESTWYERFTTAKLIGESEPVVNQCWASLIRHQLDSLWPELDGDNPSTLEQLSAINQITDRIKGSKMNGVGIAIQCNNPNNVEGFVDIFRDITSNSHIVAWANKKFMSSESNH